MTSQPVCHGFIPARYASTRFPGKPLALILGKPMFWHVYTQAKKCPLLRDVTLATDDARIFDAARALDVPVVMTDAAHPSGTDRICEAATRLNVADGDVVINIQGDEPALNPAMLTELAAPFFDDPNLDIATLAHRIDAHAAKRADQVKVAMAENGNALYFSRAAIPYSAEADAAYWGHIGLYAFRMGTLRRLTQLPPSPLERREKLEQLRFLEHGFVIRVVPTAFASRGVDRPEDIPAVEALLAAQ